MLKDKLSEHLSKSISVEMIRDQVKNTAPFLFEEGFSKGPSTRYVDILNSEPEPSKPLDYFAYCISAHFATVGTFVPTDLDLLIREKLWRKINNPEDFSAYWKLVEEFSDWDESSVSNRYVKWDEQKKLSGHQGEWFSVAMGAYGIALKKFQEFLPQVRTRIESEVKNQEEGLAELRTRFIQDPSVQTAKDYYAGTAAVAHNLGDLDRMFDAWEIGEMDVLKRRVYRCGHEDARQAKPEFLLAGKIYQELLANENHRHFPLRQPKCIRRSNDFLLNYGPFLDDWGGRIVPLLNEGEIREVAEALILGWKRLNPKSIYTSLGYARALAGMCQVFPNKRDDLESHLSPALKKEFNEGGLRTLLHVSRTQFEKQWVAKLKTYF